MSRLAQLSRLRGALRPRDLLHVKVPRGEVAPRREALGLMGAALRGRLGLAGDGELIALDEEAQLELYALAAELKSLVGAELARALEERSRYTWEAFIGHCLRWWYASAGQRPLLYALKERLADHAIELEVAWAEGERALRSQAPASQLPLWIGGLAGLALSQEFWWAPWPLATSLGLMAGWLSARPRWRCGAVGCAALHDRALAECPDCGATLSSARGSVERAMRP